MDLPDPGQLGKWKLETLHHAFCCDAVFIIVSRAVFFKYLLTYNLMLLCLSRSSRSTCPINHTSNTFVTSRRMGEDSKVGADRNIAMGIATRTEFLTNGSATKKFSRIGGTFMSHVICDCMS